MESVKRKIRSRAWAINSLKRSGFTTEELVRVYCTYVRPLAEYASVAWGPMITQEQAHLLERQQCQALKNVYGLGISNKKMCDRAGIESLQERRSKAVNKFAIKSLNNPRFKGWFPERPASLRNHRSDTRRKYEEPIIRKERHWNSPLNTMRRSLNTGAT